jgi:hypothetical protein
MDSMVNGETIIHYEWKKQEGEIGVERGWEEYDRSGQKG